MVRRVHPGGHHRVGVGIVERDVLAQGGIVVTDVLARSWSVARAAPGKTCSIWPSSAMSADWICASSTSSRTDLERGKTRLLTLLVHQVDDGLLFRRHHPRDGGDRKRGGASGRCRGASGRS